MLNLTRPLVFIDLETTGVDINQDRIVQIAVLKVFPDGTKEGKKNIFYPISNNIDTLADFTPFNLIDPTNKIITDEQGKVIFNFGQYKGQPVVDVLSNKPGYYHWMMSANFSIFTKRIITQVWEGIKRG